MSNPRILLTGRPGVGKTTVIRRALDLIGLEASAGFYTEEVRAKGRRVGFDVVTLDGRRGALARAGSGGPRVGRYGVDVDSFERLGVAALENGLAGGAELLVVDEIGKMELFSDRFVESLERVFDRDGGWSVLGTVMRARHPEVDWLWERSDIEILEVTDGNREGLVGKLASGYGP